MSLSVRLFFSFLFFSYVRYPAEAFILLLLLSSLCDFDLDSCRELSRNHRTPCSSSLQALGIWT